MFRSAQHDSMQSWRRSLILEVSLELGCWDFELLTFHIADRRESHDRFADSRELGRRNHFIDVFVCWPSFLGETGP